MRTIEAYVDVHVPADTAYAGWKQFEKLPELMKGVAAVEPRADGVLHWAADVGGVHREWDAKISEEIPGKRIAWNSIEGAKNAGCVTFHRLNDGETRIMLQLGYEPQGLVETIGDLVGAVGRRVNADLQSFKRHIEQHGAVLPDDRRQV
jgi:uncharacterized membrane protein